jgi:uncharacterized protein YcfL
MKRTILFSLILILLTTLGNAKEYKYADAWEMTPLAKNCADGHNIASLDYLYEDALVCSIDLASCKTAVSHCLGDLDVSWDLLSQVKTVYKIPDSVNAHIMWMDSQGLTMALYDNRNKTIFLTPYFETADERGQRHILTHELIHSLLMNSANDDFSNGRIEEGLTEYLAQKVDQDIDDPQIYYGNEVLVIEWLIAIYDEATIVQAVRNDAELYELIDADTKNGIGEKLNFSLLSAGMTSGLYENTIFDILAHLAKNRHREAEVRPLFSKTIALFPNIDLEYLQKLLND